MASLERYHLLCWATGMKHQAITAVGDICSCHRCSECMQVGRHLVCSTEQCSSIQTHLGALMFDDTHSHWITRLAYGELNRVVCRFDQWSLRENKIKSERDHWTTRLMTQVFRWSFYSFRHSQNNDDPRSERSWFLGWPTFYRVILLARLLVTTYLFII